MRHRGHRQGRVVPGLTPNETSSGELVVCFLGIPCFPSGFRKNTYTKARPVIRRVYIAFVFDQCRPTFKKTLEATTSIKSV